MLFHVSVICPFLLLHDYVQLINLFIHYTVDKSLWSYLGAR